MRVAWLALFVVLVSGCLWLAEEPVAEPREPLVFHLSSNITHEPGFCGDCHYGIEEFWLADWAPEGDHWTLTVRPKYPEAPLYGVHVGSLDGGSEWTTLDWAPATTSKEIGFDVGPADTLLFKVFASGPQDDALGATANRNDVWPIDVTLVSPSGVEIVVQGPEDDLHIGVVDAEPGRWQAIVDAVGPPPATLSWRHLAFTGETVPFVGDGDEAVFRFPAGLDGSPPEEALWLHPHHDHAAFQNSDWDSMDSTMFTVSYRGELGPAPLPIEWNATQIDSLWDGRTEYVFREWSGSIQGAYLDGEGHNDAGVGGSYPQFNSPDGIPVLPGTSKVRIELTWEPATNEPDFLVKMSPAHWPYFFEPEAIDRGAGIAIFEFPIAQQFWEHPDQTLEWLEPGVVRSYYDIAPYIREDGDVHAVALDYTMRAFAVR